MILCGDDCPRFTVVSPLVAVPPSHEMRVVRVDVPTGRHVLVRHYSARMFIAAWLIMAAAYERLPANARSDLHLTAVRLEAARELSQIPFIEGAAGQWNFQRMARYR